MRALIVDSVLTNAKAYLNKEIVDCSIAIESGVIQKIGKESQMPKADECINLRNLLLLPGLIDVHVHLRDEGKAYKEDFYTGTAAAAAGGFTTVLDMPNNDPVTMSPETLRNRMRIAERKVLINVGFYSEFPDDLNKVEDIVSEGAIAFKLFMANQVGGLNPDDNQMLHEAFNRASQANVPVAIHAEDQITVAAKTHVLRAEKRDDPAAFLKAHSEEAEVKAIERILKARTDTKVRVHFCHVSTKEGLAKVAGAKKSAQMVTCEVTPNHLLLSKSDFEKRGSLLAMLPPLRESLSVNALWEGLANGSVDVLGSDHAPHTLEEKMASSIWEAKVGVPGLETTLPLMLTMIKKNYFTISMLVELLAEKPAKIFSLKDKGCIEQGRNADFVVIDPKTSFVIDGSSFHSKAKFSPFDGWQMQGKPVKTFVNGHLAMEDGEIVNKSGSGGVIRREIQ